MRVRWRFPLTLERPAATPSPAPPPYTPPPSPEGLFYYAQKSGAPDFTTPAPPEQQALKQR